MAINYGKGKNDSDYDLHRAAAAPVTSRLLASPG